MFIPEIGTSIILRNPWEFMLHTESRNEALAIAAGFNYDMAYSWRRNTSDAELSKRNGWIKYGYSEWEKTVTLPAGAILTVDRVYIRKGNDDYSSLSFNLNRKSVCPEFSDFAKNIHTLKGRCRFWAKLDDVNTIEFDLIQNEKQ